MSGEAHQVPADTVERQRRASTPRHSAWVSANAGSGKTHVLTQRVVRLLLEGVPPARILCLTFTKAAAANMSIRVFERLAAWATLDDEALTAAIAETGASRPTATDLPFARKLFARTVETPGGLKIQTIHAFCERLLHLFPFEANVAARFEVLDDFRQQELLAQARHTTLEEAIADETSALSRAVRYLAEESSSFAFETLIGEALGHRETLAIALNLAGAIEGFGATLGQMLGLDDGETREAVERGIIEGGLPRGEWASIAGTLGSTSDGKGSTGNRLATAALAGAEALIDSYLNVFLTEKLEPRSDQYITKPIRKSHPALSQKLDAERDRLFALIGRRRSAETLERTLALVTIAKAVLDRYEAAKRLRGLLDFGDLIERTGMLLRRSSAAWVLYKLDSGIDHVLVDEAQDTSPQQWDILRAITADFFSGAGQARSNRTFFAVGDEKQSIFSFQGAQPAKFAAMKKDFAKDIENAGGSFEDVRLNLSFRSSATILKAIDKVFATGDHARGLMADRGDLAVHEAMKKTLPGLIELWPAVGPTLQAEPCDWRLPLDQADPQSPAVIVAQRIAATVAALTAPGSNETVEDSLTRQRRRVRPGDILILVRARNAVFEAMIRALKEMSVPVAGADRLQLTDHIAVMDLMTAGRIALLPEDDLTLACVLKSPLIGLDDDDLIALAPRRFGSLADALAQSDGAAHRAAAERIAVWRKNAARLTPFAFYARLLGAEGGRRAMLGRLGPEAGDVLDEFLALALAHERADAPSLLGFLARLEGQDLSVKRDMDAAGDAVRVMTVHAAKGLEAKIVFLPDTCGAPTGRHDPKLFPLASDTGAAIATLAWSPKQVLDPPAVVTARAALRAAAIDEYHRLLYVALTRAEERIYIAGFHGVKGKADGCWYDMIVASGLDLVEVPAPWNAQEMILQQRDAGLSAEAIGAVRPDEPPSDLPRWLTAIPSREISYVPPIKPSSALGAADQLPPEPEGFDPGSSNRTRREAAIAGRLAHKLLQHLPDLPPERRSAAAARFLSAQGGKLDADRRAALQESVLRLIAHPELETLFAAGSRAEVALAGRVTLPDGRVIAITGQIDRMGVTTDAILIADFKTGRPHTLATIPESYVAQLALYRAAVAPLYPTRPVRAYIIWTAGPDILEVPPERLDAAVRQLAAG